ncbi:adenine phosphoribosyltransferase [Actinomadura sp. 3N508]|uniref:adenine phosphoribosyltransferase n=1 Tax=Actinomadura sp. 3N508 TaxID=3375153 RepID=UPI00378ECF12
MDLGKLIQDRIRDVDDYPQPGVVFKDITPLLADHVAFAGVVDTIVNHYGRGTIDKIVGIEARGFILAAPVAYHFGAGFVPVRKKGKLPSRTHEETYDLEYGTETIEIHLDALRPGERVLIVDDVLATGGTAAAAAELVRRSGAEVAGLSVLLELSFLNGRDKLRNLNVHSLVTV